MERSRLFAGAIWVVLCSAGLISTGRAAFTTTGNVSPSDPATWTISTFGKVGATSIGTLTVDADSDLSSYQGFIGWQSGVRGTVTVDGAGSTWTNNADLYVGYNGEGTLNITDGGSVTVAGTTQYSTTYVAFNEGSTGMINFSNGTLTTQSLYASPTQLRGTGTIYTRGLVSDIDLVFDSSASRKQTLTFNSELGQNVTVNLDVTATTPGYLGAGFKGNGSLTISNGVWITSEGGDIGYSSGSTGVVTVAGYSRWKNNTNLSVGYNGSGTLNITDGGGVSAVMATYVAKNEGSTGTINFSNGTLTTRSLYASPAELTGTGTIWARGLVSDLDLVLDSTASLHQTLTLNSQPGQHVTIDLDMTGTGYGDLGAGWRGNGSLAAR